MPFNFRNLTLFILFSIIFFLPDYSFAGVIFSGRLNSEAINLRTDSTVSSPVICILNKNDKVEVVSEVYGWYKIRLPKNAPSYVRKDLLECIKFQEPKVEEGKPKPAPICVSVRVIKDRVNIRLSPSESSRILGKVEKNAILNVLESRLNWYKIEPVYQSYGWVNKKYVDKINPENAVNNNPAPLAVSLQKEDKLPVFKGIVTPCGVVLWRAATHKLLTDDGVIYLLKGNKRTLDALCSRRVKVSGKILSGWKGKYPLIEIASVEELN